MQKPQAEGAQDSILHPGARTPPESVGASTQIRLPARLGGPESPSCTGLMSEPRSLGGKPYKPRDESPFRHSIQLIADTSHRVFAPTPPPDSLRPLTQRSHCRTHPAPTPRTTLSEPSPVRARSPQHVEPPLSQRDRRGHWRHQLPIPGLAAGRRPPPQPPGP